MAEKSQPSDTEKARIARRAERLRANLQKRKAQTRARKSGSSPVMEGEPSAESSTVSPDSKK